MLTFVFVLIATAFFIPVVLQFVHAHGINPGVFPPDSRPYNLSYGDWSSKWWQWAQSIPEENSPTGDETGEKYSQDQSGPVWFLAGTRGGSAVRDCTIPA